VEKIFIGCIENKYYKIIEAIPLYSNGHSIVCEKDDYAILDDFICAIFYDSRCINSTKEFLDLSTPVQLDGSFDKYTRGSKCRIELPFESNQRVIIKKELNENGKVLNAKERFLEEVIKSNLYSINLKYIAGYQGISEQIIKEKYNKLIEQLLDLISNDNYEKYIRHIIKWCSEHINFSNGFNEYTDYNHYITFDL